ncbi:hypothetical protein Cs7R123_44120 [Catellatospora sp. TT07R-123]|uniref:protein kinase domain-containing protein n=1 Tax=Catellatospora sp. TT07R-123 TaxID=2733863 RepID=UPI001B26CFB2|nr:protein kinase [Catellatospora sp. TT07R-123]GHJ47070.1 hypothetical protein Cs7R123_44120 [Catellatospora sp. TT07R-123]
MAPTPPPVLGRRYRLVERLGAGGMAVVWRGYDEVLHRPVAVKLLSPSLAAQPDALALLRAEALAAAKLSHPHLTAVYDYGEETAPDGPVRPYLVMELVEGVTLSQALHAAPQGLGRDRTVEITAQAAGALSAAHARGIVHRDVSPSNIMLTADGVKVLDFGICVLSGTADDSDELVGTVDYMAPERVAGTGEVTAACDVYALGLIFYRCLTGMLPWPPGTPTQRLRDHIRQPPRELPTVDGLPPDLAALCMACLAKDPARRPTAAQVAVQLGPHPADLPAAAPDADQEPTRVLAMSAASLDTARLAESRRFARDRIRLRPTPVAATAALLAAGLAGVAVVGGTGATDHEGRAEAAEPQRCDVVYDERLSATAYDATVTIRANTRRPAASWRLTFTSGHDDPMRAQVPARLLQQGRRVSVTAPDGLEPGRAVVVHLTGGRARPVGRPEQFSLDGLTCQSTSSMVEEVAASPRATAVPADDPGDGSSDDGGKGKGKGKGKGRG